MIDRVFLARCVAGLVLTLGENATDDCLGCESRTWNCERACASNGQLDNFMLDFTYAHEAGSCAEIIPWNSSAMQIDADLWCTLPVTQLCNDWDCTGPMIGCHNMADYSFSGISVLEYCSHADRGRDLLAESCKWTCKHRRPVARCTLNFDPGGRLNLQNRLERCWIDETCSAEGGVANLTATCKPFGSIFPTSSAVKLYGSVVFSVFDADSFMALSKLVPALKHLFASSLRYGYDSVTIGSIAQEGRRLAWPQRDLQQLQFVRVEYTVLMTGQSAYSAVQLALLAEVALLSMKGSNIVTTMNTQLAPNAPETRVWRAVLVVTPLSLTDLIPGEPSAEIPEILALHDIYKQHLDDANVELEATREALENQNLTQKELAKLEAKHASAEKQLSNIRATYFAMQEQYDTILSKHNATSEALANAQSAALIASQQLTDAQSNLSSTQTELEELTEAHVRASQQILQALANQSELDMELGKTKLLHRQTTQTLADVSIELGEVRKLLWEAQRSHNMTSQALATSELNLLTEVGRHKHTKKLFVAEQSDHNQTKQDLVSEVFAHQETQAELESRELELSIFMLVTIVLVLMVMMLGALLLYVRRGKTVTQSPVVAFTGGGTDTVVVGRPVTSPDPDVKAMQGATLNAKCEEDNPLRQAASEDWK